MSDKPRILVTRRHLAEIEARLNNDYEIVLNEDDHTMSPDEIIAAADGVDALFVCVTEPLNGDTISALPDSVLAILTLSVGTDHIDLKAAEKRGLAVLTTPGAVTAATAEVGMLLMLGASRRAHESSDHLRAGKWDLWTPTQFVGVEITGKPLGIFGMGRIGRTVAKRARGFDMAVHYRNRNRLASDLEDGAVYFNDLDGFLAASEFLVLCAPSTPETQGFINDDTIAQLPDGAIIVNIARGDLVDDDALIAALKSGKLAAAGLDVFNGEPANVDRRYFELPNVFMVPHIGSAAREARTGMGMMLLDGFEALRAGEPVPNRVV
ncbi:MAG: D-glycerate dehydrogenase [Alphaproteobacteria bacterium]|nr:D-glycerate dehydrogenase [Alphaproteobacteria bacterium]